MQSIGGHFSGRRLGYAARSEGDRDKHPADAKHPKICFILHEPWCLHEAYLGDSVSSDK